MTRRDDIRPASEDPLGDPADQHDARQGILPASRDPLGDPADQDDARRGILPASQDPLGDPADQEMRYRYDQAQRHPALGQAQHEYLHEMPQDEFDTAADRAVQHMSEDQQDGLAGSLLGALRARGIDLDDVGRLLGIGHPEPGNVRQQGLARLLGWSRQNAPDAVDEVASQHGDLIKSMGGGVLSGILGKLAGGLFGDEERRRAG